MGLGTPVTSRGKLKLNVKVEGAPELLQVIRRMREQIADGLQAAVHAGAAVFEAEAKQLAPVLTGRMRDSIHIEIAESDSTHAVAVVGPDDSLDYPVFVEYGTRLVKAEPFMRPAFENKFDEAQAAVIEVLTEEIREAVSIKSGGH